MTERKRGRGLEVRRSAVAKQRMVLSGVCCKRKGDKEEKEEEIRRCRGIDLMHMRKELSSIFYPNALV
jgi:hypothetical protein